MREFLYYLRLKKYGIIYLGFIRDRDIVYGYNKSTRKYLFWQIVDSRKLKLMEVCSKSRAIFIYQVLGKGIQEV